MNCRRNHEEPCLIIEGVCKWCGDMPMPEHDKLKGLDGANETVGDFIEWLGENGLIVCVRIGDREIDNMWAPAGLSTQKLIARFFDIDEDKLEEEKRMLLEWLRKKQGT